MLPQKDRFSILQFLRYSSIGNFYPVDVNPKNWEVRPGRAEKWKEWLCYFFYTLDIAHAIFTSTRLIHVIVFLPEEVPLHQLVIHGELAGAYVVAGVYWYYELFIRNADVYAGFIRITLTGNLSGTWNSGKDDGAKAKGILSRLGKYSFQDLIAIFLPYMILSAEVAITACFIYDPTTKQLLYSVLPEAYKTWWSFGICLVAEVRLCLFVAGLMISAWQMQVVAFEFISNSLEALTKSVMKT